MGWNSRKKAWRKDQHQTTEAHPRIWKYPWRLLHCWSFWRCRHKRLLGFNAGFAVRSHWVFLRLHEYAWRESTGRTKPMPPLCRQRMATYFYCLAFLHRNAVHICIDFDAGCTNITFPPEFESLLLRQYILWLLWLAAARCIFLSRIQFFRITANRVTGLGQKSCNQIQFCGLFKKRKGEDFFGYHENIVAY